MIKYFKYFLLIAILVFQTGCFEELTDAPVENQAPNTFLFLYPDSSISQQQSRLKVSWWGDDPDGIVIGFYFKWEGIDTAWTFTSGNDSTFALSIGTSDTSYNFLVSAVDNEGNGVYDTQVIQNGINYGPEPFIDANGDGIYNNGERFFDIGIIDPSPASTLFPIKNSSPEIEWNSLTVLPDSSFPVMTLGWNAEDLDGAESIVKINIALNDTNNFVSLNGTTRLITIRAENFNSSNPDMEILLNGSTQNIFSEKLSGIKLNDNNKIYIQAEDISGAKSNFISLPDSGKNWYVKNPKGKLLIIDNYQVNDPIVNKQAADFYTQAFNSINGGALSGKYEVIDLAATVLPYESVTFLETVKLFDYIFWYSSSRPRLDLLNLTTNKFIDAGGKIAFSLTFEDSSASFSFDLASLQGFLPLDSLGQNKPINFLFAGANVVPSNAGSGYPDLKTSSTVSSVRTYKPNQITAEKIYELQSNQLNGNISFMTKEKNLFFIGLPLHQANGGNANVTPLLEKIFLQDFGFVP